MVCALSAVVLSLTVVHMRVTALRTLSYRVEEFAIAVNEPRFAVTLAVKVTVILSM